MLDSAALPRVDAGALNILIALPCYGGQTYVQHNRAIRLLVELFNRLGIRHQILELTSESLIPRGRNALANIAALDLDPNGNHYTHLLFLDVDIGFNPENIVQAIAWDKDITALPYPCKAINWNYIVAAVKKGVEDPTTLSRMGSRPIINTNGAMIPFNTSEPVEFPQLGTGILLIKREVLLAFTKDEKRRYNLMEGERCGIPRTFAYDFFQIGINPETRYYDSEDYRFCLDARAMGFQTWMLPWAVTSHTGTYDFFMDIIGQAQYGIPEMEPAKLTGWCPVTI